MTTKSRVGWRLCTENDTTQIWTEDLRIITYREDDRLTERYLHLQAAIENGYYKLVKGVWYNKSLKLEYVRDENENEEEQKVIENSVAQTESPVTEDPPDATPTIQVIVTETEPTEVESTQKSEQPKESNSTIWIVLCVLLILLISANIYIFMQVKQWRWDNELCKGTEISKEDHPFLPPLKEAINMDAPIGRDDKIITSNI